MKSLRLLVCGNRTLLSSLMPLALLLSFPLMGVHEVKTKEELLKNEELQESRS